MFKTNEYTILTKNGEDGKEIKLEIRPNKIYERIPAGFKVWSDITIRSSDTNEIVQYLRAGNITTELPKAPQQESRLFPCVEDLNSFTVDKLREIATQKGLNFNTKTTKPQLIELINA